MPDTRIFRYFKTSPGITRVAVMVSIRYPLSLPNVEDLLNGRGIDITRETVVTGGSGSGRLLTQKSDAIGFRRCLIFGIGAACIRAKAKPKTARCLENSGLFRHQDQSGRQRGTAGQCLRRAGLEIGQIRGGLPARRCQSAESTRLTRPLSELLQY